MAMTLERQSFNKAEKARFGLDDDQYSFFKLYIDFTAIKDLPDDLKELHMERTQLQINSLHIDFDFTCEVVAEYIKNGQRE